MGYKRDLVSIGISGGTACLLIYSIFLMPPDPPSLFLEIGIASAEHGKAKVEPDFSKITILSYSIDKRDSVVFQVKIVNEGGSSAKNFFIKMNWLPRDPLWYDPSNIPVQTKNYLSCRTALANECQIGIIPKDESVILEFHGAIDSKIYKEVANQNPRLIISYGYDGIGTITKTVDIDLGTIKNQLANNND